MYMAFHEIAVPHRNIQSKSFSSEVYAAKLWDVYKGSGHDEYADPSAFFAKTYVTDNLRSILDSVRDRLDGKGGGHFRSISTPFGGGKTHTLIALYHKCVEWRVKPVVLVGHMLDPKKETLWGLIEEQLSGKIVQLEGSVPRGGEAIKSVLKAIDQPILILIDELHQYIMRAAEVDRERGTNLAHMTITFMQELSEAASSLGNVCVVATLPSSTNEYLDDETYMQLYKQLQNVTQRTVDTITPVSDEDVPKIIRRRLFSTPSDEIRKKAKHIVDEFVDYCDREGLMPEGEPQSKYREDFLNSYPFLPQVIEVLYTQWGTIERFQRTRGVLRLLSRVVSSLSTSDKQFITLGDFDLGNNTIREELVAYLDPQFNSVIAKDISGDNSGASKVNRMVPDQFRGKNLGIRTATVIFMHSHSGGARIKGATDAEIKRATCEPGIPPSQAIEVLNLFRSHLFYLSVKNGHYLFTKDTNVLKIKIDVIENLKQHEIDEAEKNLVRENIGRCTEMKSILYPSGPKDIEDTTRLKLVILKKDDHNILRQLYDKSGESDRTYRNNMFFLVPSDGEKGRFLETLKSMIAWLKIKSDPHIKLTKDQTATLEGELKKDNERAKTLVKDYYSVLYTPEKNDLETSRVRPPLVTDAGIDRIVYDHLLEGEAVSPKIGPATLRTRYMRSKKVVETSDLLKTMLSVPGELRPTSKNVLERTIMDGVAHGEFGLGEVEDDVHTVTHFKKQALVSFEPGEVLIHASLCTRAQEQKQQEYQCAKCIYTTDNKSDWEIHQKKHVGPLPDDDLTTDRIQLKFEFSVPEGKVNHIAPMLLNIASHYRIFKIHVDASDGKMSKHDVDMIKETLWQIGSKFDL